MTTPDPWQGTGRDPWLPSRLESRLHMSDAEHDIRTAFWAALAGWLTQTARRVLRTNERPDVRAIWAAEPAWREVVQEVVQGEIRTALGLAYVRLLGDAFPWDSRPFVAGYLAEVTNRLVRVPDEVYDLVARQVATGANLGEGIPAISKRVDTVLSTTASERWPGRATVVARTETIGAFNAGRFDAFRAYAEEVDEPMQKLWLATSDARTRDTHRRADGQRVPVGQPFSVGGFELDFPGDPSGPAHEVIQCRCTMLLVEPGENVDLSNRQMRPRR